MGLGGRLSSHRRWTKNWSPCGISIRDNYSIFEDFVKIFESSILVFDYFGNFCNFSHCQCWRLTGRGVSWSHDGRAGIKKEILKIEKWKSWIWIKVLFSSDLELTNEFMLFPAHIWKKFLMKMFLIPITLWVT